MGAGQLNAKRALQQFAPGEFELMPDVGPDQITTVPTIGCDYGHTTGTLGINRYIIDTPLTAGHYISVTLAWDRQVELTIDDGVYDPNDAFVMPSDPNASDDIINDLDIFLVPLDSFTPELESFSFEGTLEHLFAPIPFDGDWEIWVVQQDADVAGGQDYGLAWWYGLVEAPGPGDFDGDGDVDGEDLALWEGSYALNDGADADGDGDSDGVDFLIWQQNVDPLALSSSTTAVPEPSCVFLAVIGISLAARCRR